VRRNWATCFLLVVSRAMHSKSDSTHLDSKLGPCAQRRNRKIRCFFDGLDEGRFQFVLMKKRIKPFITQTRRSLITFFVVNSLNLKREPQNNRTHVVKVPTYVRGSVGAAQFIPLDCSAARFDELLTMPSLDRTQRDTYDVIIGECRTQNSPLLCAVWFMCGSTNIVLRVPLTRAAIDGVESRDDWQQYKYTIAN
jgi:hypothetical protein